MHNCLLETCWPRFDSPCLPQPNFFLNVILNFALFKTTFCKSRNVNFVPKWPKIDFEINAQLFAWDMLTPVWFPMPPSTKLFLMSYWTVHYFKQHFVNPEMSILSLDFEINAQKCQKERLSHFFWSFFGLFFL